MWGCFIVRFLQQSKLVWIGDGRPERLPGSVSGFRLFRQRYDSYALLVPPISREIDGQEWSDSRPDIGKKEIQPVQTAQRSCGRRFGAHFFRCVRVSSGSRWASRGCPCRHAHLLSTAAGYFPREPRYFPTTPDSGCCGRMRGRNERFSLIT